MRNLENEKVLGLESYFNGKLRFHTNVVHNEHTWKTRAIPDDQPIPDGYKFVRFYAEGVVTYTFTTPEGKLEEYHSHDKDVTSWAGNIPVKHRLVEPKPIPPEE